MRTPPTRVIALVAVACCAALSAPVVAAPGPAAAAAQITQTDDCRSASVSNLTCDPAASQPRPNGTADGATTNGTDVNATGSNATQAGPTTPVENRTMLSGSGATRSGPVDQTQNRTEATRTGPADAPAPGPSRAGTRPAMNATARATGPQSFDVTVTDARLSDSASVTPPTGTGDPGSDGELRRLTVHSSGDPGRYEIGVRAAADRRNLSGDGESVLPAPNGFDTGLLYVETNVSASDADYDLTYRLDVDVEDLRRYGVDASAIRVFVFRDGWRPLRNVTPSRSGSEYVLDARVSADAPIALGFRHGNLTVTNATVPTDPVVANRTAAVDLRVMNFGGRTGRETFRIRSDGRTLATRSVEIAAGGGDTVRVPITFRRSGERSIEVDGVERRIDVIDPTPNVTVTAVTVDERRIAAGESVEVVANVTNTGYRDGEGVVRFRAFGSVVDAQRVTVPAGGNATVAFAQRFDAPGQYRLEVGNVSTTVSVRGGGSGTASDPGAVDDADGDGDDGGLGSALTWGLLALGVGVVLVFGGVALGRRLRGG